MSLAATLTSFFAALRATIAWNAGPTWHARTLQATTPTFWNRCSRILRLFTRLAERWQNGESLAPRPRKPREPRPEAERTPRVRHPDTHAWLIRELQPTAQVRPALLDFLARPDLAEMLRAAPQARRLLRPLCRMFGIAPPEILALPRRAPKPKPERPAIPKPRRARLRLWRGPTLPPDLTGHKKPA